MVIVKDTVIFILFFICLVPALGGVDILLAQGYLGFAIPFPSFIFLMLLFLPLVFSGIFKDGGREFLRNYHLTLWITLPLFFCSIIWILYGLHPHATLLLRPKIMLVYQFCLVIMVIAIGASNYFIEHYRKLSFGILVVICTGLWIDFFFPQTFSSIPSRAAGFSLNSNLAALELVFTTIATIDWKKNSYWNLLIFGFAGGSIFLTLSVGGIALFIGTFGLYLLVILLQRGFSLGQIIFFLIAPIFLLLILVPVLSYFVESTDTFSGRGAQLRFDEILAFFSGDFSFLTGHERGMIAGRFWDDINESPIIGHGVGYYIPELGPHNMYLLFWATTGIVGLLIYISFVLGSFYFFIRHNNTQGMVFAFVFSIASLYNHTLLSTHNITSFLGILAVIVAKKSYMQSSEDLNKEKKFLSGPNLQLNN